MPSPLATNEIPVFGGPHHGTFRTVPENEHPIPSIRLPHRSQPRISWDDDFRNDVPYSSTLQFSTYEFVPNRMADGFRMGNAKAYVYTGSISREHLMEYRDYIHSRFADFRRGGLTRAAESARLSIEGFNLSVRAMNYDPTNL